MRAATSERDRVNRVHLPGHFAHRIQVLDHVRLERHRDVRPRIAQRAHGRDRHPGVVHLVRHVNRVNAEVGEDRVVQLRRLRMTSRVANNCENLGASVHGSTMPHGHEKGRYLYRPHLCAEGDLNPHPLYVD